LFTRSFGVDTNTFQSQIGFNRTGWSSQPLDLDVDVKNYQGVFNTSIAGNEVSFERDGTLYEGFDGVSFKRILYGEERPQELALVEPLETIIIRVTSHKHLQGNTNLSSASANASTVKFQITNNIYGETEFLRIKQDGTTTTELSTPLYTYSNEINVVNASVLEKPKARLPGIIWVGTERIEYTGRNTNTNKLTGLSRGTNGTSVQDWVGGTEVFNANKSEQFDSYPTTANIWLDTFTVTTKVDGAVSNSNSINVDNDEGIVAGMTIKVEDALINAVVNSTSSNTVTVSQNVTISNNSNITFIGDTASSLSDLGNVNISDSSSIMRFLHGRE